VQVPGGFSGLFWVETVFVFLTQQFFGEDFRYLYLRHLEKVVVISWQLQAG
jgi:hypothetical protein